MPARDVAEIMKPANKHVDRMNSLMQTPPTPPAEPEAPPPPPAPKVPRTLIGANAYAALKVDAATTVAILAAAKGFDPLLGNGTRGPKPDLIGGVRGVHHWKVGELELQAIRLASRAKSAEKWPSDCPDPLQLARVVIQQWYAQWAPQLLEDTK